MVIVSISVLNTVRVLELEALFEIHYPQFADNETENQRREVIFPRSHSKLMSEACFLTPKSGAPRTEPAIGGSQRAEGHGECGLFSKEERAKITSVSSLLQHFNNNKNRHKSLPAWHAPLCFSHFMYITSLYIRQCYSKSTVIKPMLQLRHLDLRKAKLLGQETYL